MQIDVITEKSITFKLSDQDGDDASTLFGRIMNKCATEASKRGFRNMFTPEEKAFLKEFQTKVKFSEDET